MTDRARPGLVTFYDIRPGNGGGLLLPPRSPHGAMHLTAFANKSHLFYTVMLIWTGPTRTRIKSSRTRIRTRIKPSMTRIRTKDQVFKDKDKDKDQAFKNKDKDKGSSLQGQG